MLPQKASLTTQGAHLIPIFLGSLAGEDPSYLPERGICLSHGCFPRIRTSGLTDAWRWFGLGVKSSGGSTVPGKKPETSQHLSLRTVRSIGKHTPKPCSHESTM